MKEESTNDMSRRRFVHAGSLMAATAIIPGSTKKTIEPADKPGEEKSDVLDYIDPTIGNIAPLLNSNRPIVHWPNQMVRTFPRRQDYSDDQITGFPLLALNVITPQVIFSVKPCSGDITDDDWNNRLTYDHDLEVIHPWYYSTLLIDKNIRVEHTVTRKGGIYRFNFPPAAKKNILLNHCYENGSFTIEGQEITGTEFVLDAIHNQKGKAYMYGVFSGKPLTRKQEGLEKDWGKYTVLAGQPKPTTMKGEKAWASYATTDPSVVEFRYAVSFISAEQAKKNYQEELAKNSFDQLAAACKKAWQKVIGQIKVEGGTVSQKRTFYTALYRCYARMVNVSEQGNYFSAYDAQVHRDNRPFYTDDYSWGNYLALHPLRSILDPVAEADMLQSYVTMYKQSGWIPEYPKHFGDREGMFGFHSCVMFLDAYRKGIRHFDTHIALEGMLKSAEEATMLPSKNGPKGALEDFYNEHGYYPALRPGETETDAIALMKHSQRSAVSVTLAHSYDAWALSEFARELQKTAIADRYASKASNYKNLWNNEKQLFFPKDAKGNWIDIDPKNEGAAYYNENNGLTYKWYVQHDIEGLIALMGGKDELEKQLDQFFREKLDTKLASFLVKFQDMTGLTGQLSMGNQCAFFIPYLYNYTNAPWKTQKWTRYLLDVWFKDNVRGVPGDEDGGSMSAWVVFTCLGFYPLKPGIPYYSITSPVFSKISVALPGGKTFTLIAHGCSKTNKYIQSAKLNGWKLSTLWFSHNDLINGGELVLEMGELPAKE